MKIKLISAIFLLFAFIAVNCSKEEDDPDAGFTISSISPESGAEGTLVSIFGTGFSEIDEENIVKFNGKEAVVQLSTGTGIAATVPSGATTGTVSVTIKGKTVTGPVFTVVQGQTQVTKTYYLKFKSNGTIKIFEDGNPGFQSCGDCACSYMPALSDSRNASLNICNDSNDWVTAADIQGWNGDKVLFTGIFPHASFGFTENNIDYSTDYAADQGGSEVNITSVVADGESFGSKAFKVSGNFKCKVAKSDGSGAATITEGQFVVRYTED
jgi:hypothetical protein